MLTSNIGTESLFRQYITHCFTAASHSILVEIPMDLTISINTPTFLVKRPGCLAYCFMALLLPTRHTYTPFVVTTPTHGKHSTQIFQFKKSLMSINPGVPYRDCLAKYAAAFFNISFSIRNCAFSSLSFLSS